MSTLSIPHLHLCRILTFSSSNFEERVPKKDYPDYYKLIKKPTSISDVRGLVESEEVQDWDALAKEVRLIWDNAKEYNQEGSDIYLMAEKLEVGRISSPPS